MSYISAILHSDPHRYGRIPAACSRYGWNRSCLYKLAGKGQIVLRKIGRSTYVDFESCDRFMTSLPVAKIKLPPGDVDTAGDATEVPASPDLAA